MKMASTDTAYSSSTSCCFLTVHRANFAKDFASSPGHISSAENFIVLGLLLVHRPVSYLGSVLGLPQRRAFDSVSCSIFVSMSTRPTTICQDEQGSSTSSAVLNVIA
jgi:hypothetical protein